MEKGNGCRGAAFKCGDCDMIFNYRNQRSRHRKVHKTDL